MGFRLEKKWKISDFMRILFLPNFEVHGLTEDDSTVLAPNKIVNKEKYWFFKYFPNTEVTVIDNISPFPFNLFSKYFKFELYQAFKALLTCHKYDVILSHSYNSGFIFSLLRSILHMNTPPHFIIDVGCLNGGAEKRFQIRLLKFALKSVYGLIYHSTINEKFYSRYFPKIYRIYVPFGTDPEYFKPFVYPPKEDYILSIGYAKRDYNTLIEAWNYIKFPLKIVGITNECFNGSESIEFIPKVPVSVLKEYIHNAKLVILPIENDKHSVGQMTLTQCMAMGKAIIVTRVFGVIDYLNNGVNCLAIDHKSESDIVETVNLLLKNPDLVKNISLNAREDVIQRFNEKCMAVKIYNFIKKDV